MIIHNSATSKIRRVTVMKITEHFIDSYRTKQSIKRASFSSRKTRSK